MNLLTAIITSFVFMLCLFGGKPAAAQNVRETTYVKRDGPTIVVRAVGPVEVVKVEPYMDAKEGKKIGSLNLQVVIKNTAHKPRTYDLFGQGKTGSGGRLGGATKAPKQGPPGSGERDNSKGPNELRRKIRPRRNQTRQISKRTKLVRPILVDERGHFAPHIVCCRVEPPGRMVTLGGWSGLFLCLWAAFSLTRAYAADVPDWWIGPKAEYETLVNGAREEGHLVLWSHPDPSCTPLIAGAFEKEYGVEVEHTEYTTAQIVQRILLEGVAGMYTVDVGNLSVHHVPRLEQKGLLQQLHYRENVTTYREVPKMVSPHSTAFIGWTSPRGLAYNTKIPKDKVPNSYEDVLNPMFANRKISVDTDLKEYIILAHQWGLEKTKNFVKRLGAMKPKFHPNNTVITQMVAAGETLIAPGVIRRIPLYEFKNKGAPIDWKPCSRSYP